MYGLAAATVLLGVLGFWLPAALDRGVRPTGVELSEDQKEAVVKARLARSARSVASEGALFWIVRPQIGLNQVTGLNTVLSGPEIHARPGRGEIGGVDLRAWAGVV